MIAASRLSPIDGSNLNRVFPGDRLGTFSEALADFIVRGIFPRIDFVSDLHAGGTSLEYLPLTMMHRTDDLARNAKSLDCMKAFGAPVALFSVDQEPDGLLEWNAEIRGKIVVAAELGGAGRVTPRTIEIAETGIRNILAFAGSLDAPIVPPEAMGRPPTRMMATPDLDCLVLSPDDGIFEPLVALEDDVARGQPLGRLHNPRWRQPAACEYCKTSRKWYFTGSTAPGNIGGIMGDVGGTCSKSKTSRRTSGACRPCGAAASRSKRGGSPA